MVELRNHDDILIALGNRIKQLRLQKKIKQSHLALNCDMEKSTLSKIENGKVNISYITLIRLSRGLEVSAGELITSP